VTGRGKKRKWLINSEPSENLEEQIELDLMKLVTDYLVLSYPTSPTSRVKSLLRVATKYAVGQNMREVFDICKDHCYPGDGDNQIVQPRIIFNVEKERESWIATLNETPVVTKARNNRISSLRQTAQDLKKDESNHIDTLGILHQGLLNPKETFTFWRGENAKSFDQLSEKDVTRLHFQIHNCLQLWGELLARTQQKLQKIILLLEKIKHEARYLKDMRLKEFDDWNANFSQTNSINKLVEKVRNKILPETLRPSTKSILQWYNDFKKRGLKGWNLSMSGHYQRKERFEDIQIGDESLESRMKIYLAIESDVSLDKCRGWLIDLIQNNYPGPPNTFSERYTK
jgi:hypothetical protein